MAQLLPFLGPFAVPEPTPHERFTLLRREMNRAFCDWLRTRPDTESVLAEIIATGNTLEQFRQILDLDAPL